MSVTELLGNLSSALMHAGLSRADAMVVAESTRALAAQQVDAGIDAMMSEVRAQFKVHGALLDHLNEKVDDLKEALAATNARMDAGFKDVDARMDAGFRNVNARMDAGFKDMNARIDTGLRDVNARIDALVRPLLRMLWVFVVTVIAAALSGIGKLIWDAFVK